jgi:signal transduction histidine kinase
MPGRIPHSTSACSKPSVSLNKASGPCAIWPCCCAPRCWTTWGSDVPVELSISGDVDTLSDEVRTCVYRIVQEALTNAGRHAHASNIRVAIERIDRKVTAVIEDDGVGFERRHTRLPGLGLLGMEERVRELHGTLEIRSRPGPGTRIRIQIPVPEKQNELSGVDRG